MKKVKREDILNSKVLKDFISSYDNYSETTQKSYENEMVRYFKFSKININPDDYFNPKRDYEQDVLDYSKSLNSLASKTRSARMSCIKMFLQENDIEFKTKFWKRKIRKRIGKVRSTTIDKSPTHPEFKIMMYHATLRAKALFFISISSGMRISEILGLEYDDIYWDEYPVRINVRAKIAKNKVQRTTFISQETKFFLIEWLKIRDDSIKTSFKKSGYYRKKYRDNGFELHQKNGEWIIKKDGEEIDITKYDKRIFPFTYATANDMWNNILTKSGMDQRDENTKIRIHIYHINVLRKFYRSYIVKKGDMHEDVARHLMGQHGYLTQAYDRYEDDIEGLAESYKKAVHAVTIYGVDDEELKSKDNEIAKRDKIIGEKDVELSEREEEIVNKVMNKVMNEIMKKLKDQDLIPK